jgi:TonB-linked SusC/RagA family outer membrane protein
MLMPKFKTGLLSFFLLLGSALFAQEKIVKGKVVAAKDNMPLPGVTITANGTKVKAVSADDGSFSITVPGQASVLGFSNIGYLLKEVSLAGNTENLTVVLSEDPKALSEVVVTSFGFQKRLKSVTYATQTLKTSELKEIRDANIVNTFVGKIAGANIVQSSGGVGGATRLVLRGNRSLGNNNALFVVDGVPINNSTTSNITSDFSGVVSSDGISNINPDDIESVNVLRGASGAALYGSAAANGAIIITTKKGKNGKLAVNLNSGVTTERVFALPQFQNTYGQGLGGVINSGVGANWGEKMTGQPFTNFLGASGSYAAQPNNVKDFFANPVTFNNSISVLGGSENAQTYLSYSNYNGGGIIPGNKIDRHTVNLRLSNQITSKLSTDAKVTYMTQQIDNIPMAGEENTPVSNIYQIPRNVSTAEAENYAVKNNLGVDIPAPWPSTISSIYQNPYWLVNKTSINQKKDRLIGFISARYQFSPWFTLQTKLNIDKSFIKENSSFSQGTLLYAGNRGTYRQGSFNETLKWFDIMIVGKGNVTKDIAIDYQAGAIYQDAKSDIISGVASGLNIPNRFILQFGTLPTVSNRASQQQTQSVFAKANISYKDFLFLDASIRNDWSSTLPSPHSFAYPSVGLSAVVSEMVNLPKLISFLKLNASYAKVGNATSPYGLLTQFSYAPAPGYTGIGFISQDVNSLLPTLKPEITKSIEFGADIRFFNNRLGINAAYYKTNSVNQILNVAVPNATGYFNSRINTGDIENKGFEVVINAMPVKSKNLSWDITLNYGANTNKVKVLSERVKQLSLDGSTRSAFPRVVEGSPFGELFGTGWRRDANGNFLVSAAGLPLGSTSPVRLGNYNPKATLGLTNTVNFKQFAVRILVDGKIGGEVVDGTEMNLANSGGTESTVENRGGGWILPGLDPTGAKNGVAVNAQSFWTTVSGKRAGWAEFFTYDQTNFRVREVSLAYTFDKLKVVKSARISVFARNLFWLYRGKNILKIPGLSDRKLSFDPDMSLGVGNYQGVNYGALPSTRSMGVNLQITL